MSWPTNKQFQKFAALVADGVQFALSKGWQIRAHTAGCCPLAAAMQIRGYNQTSAFNRGFPAVSAVAKALGLRRSHVSAFTLGFDGVQFTPEVSRPYFLLGRAYRQRYVEGRRFLTHHT